MIKVCFGDKYDDVSYGKEQNILGVEIHVKLLPLRSFNFPCISTPSLSLFRKHGMLNVN